MAIAAEYQKLADALPYYKYVPKTLHENLAFRERLILEARNSADDRRRIIRACKDDPLFYINAMCWLNEPRPLPGKSKINPFITYEYQDEAVLEINNAIENGYDLLACKTRDMGITWTVLTVYQWRWNFKELESFKVMSISKDEVDLEGDQDSLFYKLDFLIKTQPRWMTPGFDPQRSRANMIIRNLVTGSAIVGDATTEDAGSGGRKTSMFFDEFSKVQKGATINTATADVTRCRIFVSTPKGTNNEFYKLFLSPIKKLDFHWPRHPDKAKGLWFDADGKPRSPWYDQECARRTPEQVAQELDRCFLGSGSVFFQPAMISEYQGAFCMNPAKVGNLEFDADTLDDAEFIPDENGRGPFKLWAALSPLGTLPPDIYVVGCDVAAGTGATPSTMSISSRTRREKVAEYSNSKISPDKFAELVVATCKWLKNIHGGTAFLIWEANGSAGGTFTSRMIDLGYKHVYFRTNEKTHTKKQSDTPGWYTTPASKAALLGEYRRALNEKLFVNRSMSAIEECRAFIWSPDGSIDHSGAMASADPSSARENHGDMVIADALGWWLLKSETLPDAAKPEVPRESVAWRRIKYLEGQKKKTYWTDRWKR